MILLINRCIIVSYTEESDKESVILSVVYALREILLSVPLSIALKGGVKLSLELISKTVYNRFIE